MRRLAAALFVLALAAPDAASAHPRPVPPDELSSHWTAPPAVIALAVLAVVLFAQALVRLRRRGRGDLTGADRVLLFAAGLALAVLPLVSPLDAAGDGYLLSAHMLQHVLIADAAPALLVLALRGPLGFFLLAPPVLRRLAPLRPLLRVLLRPQVAFAIWLGTIFGWHFPSAYDYALLHPWAHELEHATFVLAGTLAWMQIVDPARRVFGLSPLLDQRLVAAVMLVEQALTVHDALLLLLQPAFRSVYYDGLS